MDLIIVRDDAPRLTFGGADTVLAEGVFAVIEVKSNLTREKLIEAINTLRRVRDLELRSTMAISSGPVLNRPLRCIFSYESATFETLTSEISKPENADVADLICILDKGVIISRGVLVGWNNENPFVIIKGNAASIAFLYQHLVGYSANFIGRVIDLDPYFEPFNGWIDPELWNAYQRTIQFCLAKTRAEFHPPHMSVQSGSLFFAPMSHPLRWQARAGGMRIGQDGRSTILKGHRQ